MLNMILSGNYTIMNILIFILSDAVVIFLTLPIHEAAHAYTAVRLGDPTPRYQGRLTLNPFKHLDPIGALMIVFVGFGWAKPVAINARNFKNPKLGMALTAFAGPCANIVMAFISLLFINVIIAFTAIRLYGVTYYILMFLNYVAFINITLAVFNLIPIPPLDGSRVLAAVLPDRIYFRIMQYERILYMVVIVLVVGGALSGPLSYITDLVYNGLYSVAELPFRLIGGA